MTKYATIRVSSDEQVKHGLSLNNQETRVKEFGAKKENIFTDEGKSASFKEEDYTFINNEEHFGILFIKKKRPNFGKMLSIIKPGDEVIFTQWDRISRFTALQKIFQKYCQINNIELTPTDDTLDPLLTDIKGSMSEEEIKKLKHRIMAVRIDLFKKGIHPYRCPFGYKKNEKTKEIEINPKEAEIVKKVFELSLTKGYKEICQELNINPQTYYNIIKNDIYIGIIHLEKESKKGVHEPIISEELFNKIKKET